MKKREIILASASPRRIKMMKEKGYDPEIIPSKIDEALPFSMGMETAVMYLALKKALDVESRLTEQKLNKQPCIIAADTVVFSDRIIGKPQSKKDAFSTLWSLKGQSHYVATGVALLQPSTSAKRLFCETTKVFFKEFTRDELLKYVDTEEPYDKAGGYAIQGTFGKYVDHIEGDYDNVIGFPWSRIEKELTSL